MRKFSQLLIVLISSSMFGQTYIYDDFNYPSFEYLDSLYRNQSRKLDWTTHHATNKIDINENGALDTVENFKKVSIVQDPFNYNNKIIRFELNRVDPLFYAKHFCDDSKSDNELLLDLAMLNYDSKSDAVCVNCTQSPFGKSLNEYKTHMNRNEIALGTKARRKSYKVNKDYWVGFKMLIDEAYELDVMNNSESVFQFVFKGVIVKNPPVALLVTKGRFRLASTKNNGESFEYFDLGVVNKNEWIHWKIHINLSSKDDKAMLDVWRNNELIASVDGSNTILKDRYYIKMGIYKWGWWDCNEDASDTRKKVISFDDVWVSKKDNSAVYRQ